MGQMKPAASHYWLARFRPLFRNRDHRRLSTLRKPLPPARSI